MFNIQIDVVFILSMITSLLIGTVYINKYMLFNCDTVQRYRNLKGGFRGGAPGARHT